VAKDTFHVVPHNGGWSVKREGNERASSTHDTQKEAIDSARALAREGDDLVIHRADGTIRERVTPLGAAGGGGDGGAVAVAEPHDVVSVGSRVSWQAILAGLAVAVTTYVGLTLFAVAVGVSTVDTIQSRTFAVGAAVIGIFNLLVALFLGGYVASRLSTRETRGESVVYGVLVWAALFFTLLLSGINLGSSFGMMAQVTRPRAEAVAAGSPPAADAERRRAEMQARGERLMSEMDPVAVAWWAFAGMALSVLAAIGGSVVGAGPDHGLRWAPVRRPQSEAGAAAPQPA